MSRMLLSRTVPLIFLAVFLAGSHSIASERDEAFKLINEARATARTGQYPEALDKLEEAISFTDLGGQKLAMAIAHNNMAAIYLLQRNTLQALNHHYQALRIYNEIAHRNGIVATGRQIDEILAQPETGSEKSTPGSTRPPVSKISAETRQRLLNEAMKRVRIRIKTRQAETEGGKTVPSQASRKTPAPPQDPLLPQSAKTESAKDVKQAEYNTYLERVKRSVFRAWEPEQASRNKEQGKVVLEFTILRDGRLDNMRILRSSGYPTLDREAMRAVKAVSPFQPLPERTRLSELSIRYTFNYSLK